MLRILMAAAAVALAGCAGGPVTEPTACEGAAAEATPALLAERGMALLLVEAAAEDGAGVVPVAVTLEDPAGERAIRLACLDRREDGVVSWGVLPAGEWRAVSLLALRGDPRLAPLSGPSLRVEAGEVLHLGRPLWRFSPAGAQAEGLGLSPEQARADAEALVPGVADAVRLRPLAVPAPGL